MLVFATAYTPMIMILARVRGKEPSLIDIVRFAVALIGMYLFIERSGSLSIIGITLAALNAFTYGLYNTLVEWRLSAYKTQTITLHILTQTAIVFGVAYLIKGGGWPNVNGVGWGLILWVGIVGTVAARMFRFAGLKHAGNTEAALIAPLETVGAILLAVLLLNEQLTQMQWIGSSLVVFSVALVGIQPIWTKLLPFMRRRRTPISVSRPTVRM